MDKNNNDVSHFTDFDSDDSVRDPNFLEPRTFESSSTSTSEEQASSNNILFEKYFNKGEKLNNSNFQRKRHGIKAECRVCKKYIIGSTQVTSNLITHLKRHSEEYNEYIGLKKTRQNEKKTNKKTFDQVLVNFLSENMLPISIVGSSSFINLINFANPNIKVVCRQTATKKIAESYAEMITKMVENLSNQAYVCTTADIWSTKHRSFLGYTCHYISKNYKRISMALACKRFAGSHTHDRISNMIFDINRKFCLNSNKIIATTTDNGRNFIKAFKEFGINEIKILECDEEVDDDIIDDAGTICEISYYSLPKHIRCASHSLNLLGSTDFIKIIKKNSTNYNLHIKIMAKCNTIWTKINRPKSSEIIKRIIGVQLKYPIATRWNSLYDSVEHLLSKKEKLEELCDALSIEKFTEHEFNYLLEYKTLFEPIAKAIDFLQGENSTFYGYLLPTLATISNKIKKMINWKHIVILENEAKEIEAKLRDRFLNYFNLSPIINDAIIASVLHPTIKLSWLNALNDFDSSRLISVSNIVTAYLENIHSENPQIVLSHKNNDVLEVDKFFDFSLQNTNINNNEESSGRSIQNEYSLYIADLRRNVEMLEDYPLIKEGFLKTNTPLPSSGPVERLFSYAGMVNSPRRGLLSDENFEKLVLLKVNSIMHN